MGEVKQLRSSYQCCSLKENGWEMPLKERLEYYKVWGTEHYCAIHGIHFYLADGEYAATIYSDSKTIREKNGADYSLQDKFTIRDRNDHEWVFKCPKDKVINVVKFLKNQTVLHYLITRGRFRHGYMDHLIAVSEIKEHFLARHKVVWDGYMRNFEKIHYALDESGKPLQYEILNNQIFLVHNPNVTVSQKVRRRNMLNKDFDKQWTKLLKQQRLELQALRNEERH